MISACARSVHATETHYSQIAVFPCFSGTIQQGYWYWLASWAPAAVQRQSMPPRTQARMIHGPRIVASTVTSEPHPQELLPGVSVV